MRYWSFWRETACRHQWASAGAQGATGNGRVPALIKLLWQQLELHSYASAHIKQILLSLIPVLPDACFAPRSHSCICRALDSHSLSDWWQVSRSDVPLGCGGACIMFCLACVCQRGIDGLAIKWLYPFGFSALLWHSASEETHNFLIPVRYGTALLWSSWPLCFSWGRSENLINMPGQLKVLQEPNAAEISMAPRPENFTVSEN